MARLRLCPFAALAGLLLTIAACIPPQDQRAPSLAQAASGKIEPSLREHLQQSGSEELVPVILILERQVTEEEKARLFSQTETQNKLQAKQQERELLIQELKRVAATEQSEILELLDAWEAEGLVRHIRPLWLTNVIGLEARRSAIEKLAALQRIQTILWDPPRQVEGVEWGVKKIQADQVWTLPPTGYDGTGVTVAILDTGVDYTHWDLRDRMWINTAEDKDHDNRFTARDNDGVDDDGNGYTDDVVGWNFSGSGSNDPAPTRNSHGTHVAGIVAGDGTEGSRTGVAPGARIMALRRSSDVFQYSTQQECWEGMQYALDNHADIVNFSAGWHDNWNPKPDYKRWRDNVKNLMHGGVLFVTITHNDENRTGAPKNVRTPGRVPVALTVGSTDRTDKISKLSNHGPVTWQTVRPFLDYPWPPGLRKPDVTAPGVDIISTVLGGGYGPMCGTSMAAPHVAGLAALLLEKDPSLSPYDLKFIIEETSFPLSPKPDNVFGWGRIDALEAIKYRISPLPYDLATDRAGLDIWVDNDDNGKPNDPVPGTNHLYARIRNLGGQVVSDVEVRFYSFGARGASCGSGPRKRIGTYRVPILGPESSRHETALAVIHWEFQTGDPRCIGVEIAAHPPNRREMNLSNNTGFREL